MTRFIVDAQLPTALARWLGAHGHVAEHVADLGMGGASDTAIWDFALAMQAVIITKDEDFAKRRMQTKIAPVIVWVRLPNTRRRQLLTWFEPLLPHLTLALQRGEALIELI
jgi:predicted nuclease of predicted toxin-antitoxin system